MLTGPRGGRARCVDVCRRCLTGVREQGCPSPSTSVVGASRVSLANVWPPTLASGLSVVGELGLGGLGLHQEA